MWLIFHMIPWCVYYPPTRINVPPPTKRLPLQRPGYLSPLRRPSGRGPPDTKRGPTLGSDGRNSEPAGALLLLDNADIEPMTYTFESVTPREGKRPKTTPSMSCTARHTDRPDFLSAPAGERESTMHLRVKCGSEVPPAESRVVVNEDGHRRRVNPVPAQHTSPSQLRLTSTAPVGKDSFSEAQAMTADEARPPLNDDTKGNSGGVRERSIHFHDQRGHVTDSRDHRAQHFTKTSPDQNAIEGGVTDTGPRETSSAAPAYEPFLSSDEPRLPQFRENFSATMGRSQDTHHHLREDLVRYMEDVRAR